METSTVKNNYEEFRRPRNLLEMGDLDTSELNKILDTAKRWRSLKSFPPAGYSATLLNLCLENSSMDENFRDAADSLGLKKVNAKSVEELVDSDRERINWENFFSKNSSIDKGETEKDTLRTLRAIYCPDIVAIRASNSQKDYYAARDIFNQQVLTLNGELKHSGTLLNLFFEPSTRTRCTFQSAAKRLGLKVEQYLDRSLDKGETEEDTVRRLVKKHRPDIVVIRTSDPKTVEFAAEVMGSKGAVINAGGGICAHPTQALLDLMTIRDKRGDFENLSLAIVGDVHHSRVARSLLKGLSILGVKDLRLIGPEMLLPSHPEALGARNFTDLAKGLAGVEVIVTLRPQIERMPRASLPLSLEEYRQGYRLDHERLGWAAQGAFVLHPGPINRDIEITSELADDSDRSLILKQVENGLWVRMAVMEQILLSRQDRRQMHSGETALQDAA